MIIILPDSNVERGDRLLNIRFEKISPQEQEEILVRSQEMTTEIVHIMHLLDDAVSVVKFCGAGNKAVQISAKDILYVESVDNKSFVYCGDEIIEVKHKLYEIESELQRHGFFRASKSLIINSNAIKRVSPELSGRFRALMSNGETVIVSRKYVPVMKDIFGV